MSTPTKSASDGNNFTGDGQLDKSAKINEDQSVI